MHWRHLYRLHWLPAIAALATFVLIVVRAISTVDPYWDTLAYHWPFAARLGGLCDRDCYALSAAMEAALQRFSPLASCRAGPSLASDRDSWRRRSDQHRHGGRAGGLPQVSIRRAIGMVVAGVPCYSGGADRADMRAIIDLPRKCGGNCGADGRAPNPGASRKRPAHRHRHCARRARRCCRQQVSNGPNRSGNVVGNCRARDTEALDDRSSTLHQRIVALALAGALVLLPKLVINMVSFGNPFYPIEVNFGPIHLPGVEGMIVPQFHLRCMDRRTPVRCAGSLRSWSSTPSAAGHCLGPWVKAMFRRAAHHSAWAGISSLTSWEQWVCCRGAPDRARMGNRRPRS